MDTKAKNTDKLRCIISAIIIVGCYTVERFVTLIAPDSRALYLIEAMAFSLAVAVTYFIVIKAENVFYGILPAIMGLRMLPPSINQLGDYSTAAEIIYYIVGRFSIVIFAFAILRLYKRQENENKISGVAILSLMLVVPFTNGISSTISGFITDNFSVTKLYAYFISFACYTAALLVILFIGTKCNLNGARLIADYTMVALCVNAARRIVIIIYNLANSSHISRSYFCWIAIYAFFFVAFYILRKKKLAESN